MRAIMTCVGKSWSDILAVTLPYNRHHFESILVVTSVEDAVTKDVVKSIGNASIFATDLFRTREGKFDKWPALEAGLDFMGREGWLCVMDCDVLWPKSSFQFFNKGNIYSPFRKMFKEFGEPSNILLHEDHWKNYPLHLLHYRWPSHMSGYTQIFHADDPVLKDRPWFPSTGHAGGSDTEFMLRWSKEKRIRILQEVLHLGKAGTWRNNQ